MTTIVVTGFVFAFLAAILVLMERTRQRTAHLPRAPFSVDAEGIENADYRRQLAELRAAHDLLGRGCADGLSAPRLMLTSTRPHCSPRHAR